jgi:hypothetical protein
MIEIIHHEGCPRLEEARLLVRGVLADLGLPVGWREWNQQDPNCPEALRYLPSPTIRICGASTVDSEPDAAAACRLGPLWTHAELKAALQEQIRRRSGS